VVVFPLLVLLVAVTGTAVASGTTGTASTTGPAGTAGAASASTDGAATLTNATLPADATEPAGDVNQSGTSNVVRLTRELRLTPDRPGEIRVRFRFDVPDSVTELETGLPQAATVTGTAGFSFRDGKYVWDGETDNPSVTVRLPANETREASGPLTGRGNYLFVDTGQWALVRVPQASVSVRSFGQVSFERESTVDGPGAASQAVAFLGEHTQHQRTAHGQTFRLIVPERASLAESPGDILEAVAGAADAMRVGDRDETVFMVAAPTSGVGWAVQGLQTGDADLWVRDTERLASADNVWIHEYVHTRQDYQPATDVGWFTEASATYYAALLALEGGYVSFEDFRRRIGRGTEPRTANAILADPDTWNEIAPYLKGALVAGELDRRSRLAGGTLRTVFRRMNADGDTVTAGEFREFVTDAGDTDVAAAADRYTTTDAVPSMWTSVGHQEAFGTPVPRIEYQFPDTADADGFRVDGPYRTDAVGGDRPVRLATGERFEVDVVVRNAGDASGEFDARLSAGGEQLGRETGVLAPGEQRTFTFAHTFESAGEYRLSVDGARVGVSVRDPPEPAVLGLRANASRVVAGGTVELAATVHNRQSLPAVGTLALARDGATVESREVVLASGVERTETFVQSLDTPGTYRFEVANRTESVTVDPEPTDTPTETTADATGSTGDGPAPGPATTLLVATLAALALGRRAWYRH